MLKKLWIMLIYIVGCVCTMSGADFNNITFKHLTTDNGLSQISVNDIYVGEKGRIWIGTREGLNCYDGKQIKVYRLDKTNPYSLFSNTVLRITGDMNGHVYVLCQEGLAMFDMETERFHTLYKGKLESLLYDGALYVGEGNKVLRYSNETGTLQPFLTIPDENVIVTDFYQDHLSRWWIGTAEHGLFRFEKNRRLTHLLDRQHISRIYQDKRHNIWIGTWDNGAHVFHTNGKMEHLLATPISYSGLATNFVRCFVEDNQGNMWLGTSEGLCCYHPQTKTYRTFTASDSPTGLTHSSIWSITRDAQGTIWVGTYFGGVNYFNPEYEIYTKFYASNTPNGGLSYPVVGNMMEDEQGNIWICTEGGGLNIYNRSTNTFKWYTHSNTANSISHNNVKAIYYDKNKQAMWIATHLGGLNRLDLRTQQFTIYRHQQGNSASLPSDIIRDVLPYGNDSLVVATQVGVCMFDKKTGVIRQMFQHRNDMMRVMTVPDLEYDKDGHLWFSALGNGVYELDFKTQQVKHYQMRVDGLSNNNVNSIYCDSQNRIWFSTSGSGLDCLDQKTGRFVNYDSRNVRLLSDCIYRVAEYDNKELLIISNEGFSMMNLSDKKVKNYNQNNGFPLSTINENGLLLSHSGEVYLGGVSGMVHFKLEDLKINPKHYIMRWEKLTVNGVPVEVGGKDGILSRSVGYTDRIDLGPDEHMFSLYFSTSNYLAENSEEMEYCLEGFSDKWNTLQGQNVITYTNLNPGKYVLKLRSAHPETLSEPIEMTIVIHPPFYRTGLAYFLYIVLIIGVIYYLLKMYQTRWKLQESLKYEQLHLKDLEELNQSKLRFFTSISHEFRTPLTLIIGQLESLKNNTQLPQNILGRLEKAYQSGLQLKALINELLDFRKQDQDMMKLKVAKVNFGNYMSDIYKLFIPFAESNHIHFTLEKEDDIEVWIDAEQMRKVVNNLLSNAFKFVKREGEVAIKVWKQDDVFCFSVTDNGIGIIAEDLDKIFQRFYQSSEVSGMNVGTGIGLALAKGIVELHGGKITVKSVPGEGATFCVCLPFGKSHFSKEVTIVENEQSKEDVFTPETNPVHVLSNLYTNESLDLENTDTLLEVNGKKPTILIVEDNQGIRQMLVELFSRLYDVVTAADGEEALLKIAEGAPHIILSDVFMPRMSGIELVRQLKTNLDTCHIPVILLTARTEVEHNMEGLKTGADDYVTKPFDSRLLILRCNNLVNSRRVLQEYFTKQPVMNTPALATNALDKEFLDNVMAIFEKHIDNTDFTIDQLAQEMFISRTRIYAKIKAITGQTPNDFFITLRLKKAAHLLKNNPALNITQISDQTGFSSPRYFSKLFKKTYGVTPMTYREGKEVDDATVAVEGE